MARDRGRRISKAYKSPTSRARRRTRADERLRGDTPIRPVLLWRGDESSIARQAGDIRPGDTLVIPAAYGGIMGSTGLRAAASPSPTLAIVLRPRSVSRPRCAFTRLCSRNCQEAFPRFPSRRRRRRSYTDDQTVIGEWLAAPGDAHASGDAITDRIIRLLLPRTTAERHCGCPSTNDESSTRRRSSSSVPNGPCRLRRRRNRRRTPSTTSRRQAHLPEYPIGLYDHLDDVGEWARSAGHACGLPATLADDLSWPGASMISGRQTPDSRPCCAGADHRRRAARQVGRPGQRPRRARAGQAGSRLPERRRPRTAQRGPRPELTSAPGLGQRLGPRPVPGRQPPRHLPALRAGHPRQSPAHRHCPLRRAATGSLKRDRDGAYRLGDRRPVLALVRRYGWFGLAWLETSCGWQTTGQAPESKPAQGPQR